VAHLNWTVTLFTRGLSLQCIWSDLYFSSIHQTLLTHTVTLQLQMYMVTKVGLYSVCQMLMLTFQIDHWSVLCAYYYAGTEMPVSSPPYKDVPVPGQVQMLSPRPLSLSVPQTSTCSVYCAPELITAHTHTNGSDDHREPMQQDSNIQCRRPVSTSPASVRSDSSLHFFNTHSPPLLNLSPNLSPSMSDVPVVSPCYDLRESTRRQSSLYGE